jgi:hypothetical protein
VAGLLGAQVYHGKQLAPFADNQPMLITSLLLNASACYLRDPSVCGDPALTPFHALHLAVAAMVLQPRYGKAYYRAACALSMYGGGVPAAHAIMRHAAQLDGRPAAELLAHLPPLPPGDVETSILDALQCVACTIYAWPGVARELAPAGQDFLLQLPGRLGELPPSLASSINATFNAESNVAAALEAKERGNTAFAAGDMRAALDTYHNGIDCLRTLTATYLGKQITAVRQEVNARPLQLDGFALHLASMRLVLLPLLCLEMLPYKAPGYYAAQVSQKATTLLQRDGPLSPAACLPGVMDMASLVGTFWAQLTAKFTEPVGGVEGLLAHEDTWKHRKPMMCITERFNPFCLRQPVAD